jgi:hypothetical protein
MLNEKCQTKPKNNRNYAKRFVLLFFLSFVLGLLNLFFEKISMGLFLSIMMLLVVPCLAAIMFLSSRNYLKIVSAGAISWIAFFSGAFLPLWINGSSKEQKGAESIFVILLIFYLLFFMCLTFIYRLIMEIRERRKSP